MEIAASDTVSIVVFTFTCVKQTYCNNLDFQYWSAHSAYNKGQISLESCTCERPNYVQYLQGLNPSLLHIIL